MSSVIVKVNEWKLEDPEKLIIQIRKFKSRYGRSIALGYRIGRNSNDFVKGKISILIEL